jgi:hypothetical protein
MCRVVLWWLFFGNLFLFFAKKYKDLTNNLEVLVQVKVFFSITGKERITNYVGWYAPSV